MGLTRSFALGSVLSLAFVLGCAESGPHLSFAVEQRILRETTLDDMPADKAESGDGVVRIVRMGMEGHGTGSCSGALVDPLHVITAAHCVVDVDGNDEMVLAQVTSDRLHVELGGDYLPWGRVSVRHVSVCEDYDGSMGNDVAVLVLAQPVPPVVATLPIGFDDVEEEGATLALGGFGSSEKMRAMPGTGWALFIDHRHDYEGPIVYSSRRALAFRAPGVPGDSGGPIKDAHTGRLVSVVSRGIGEPDDPDSDGEDADREAIKKIGPLVAGPRLSNCRSSIERELRVGPKFTSGVRRRAGGDRPDGRPARSPPPRPR